MRFPRVVARWNPRGRAADLRAESEAALLAYLREEVLPFSAFYRKRFAAEGVGAGDLRTIEDFRRLPFTTKADLVPTDEAPDRPLEFLLRPDADSVRAHWGIARKAGLLARRLVGQSPRDALERAYRPVFLTATTGRSSAPVSFLYATPDMERLAEAGGRLADVLGFSSEDRGLSVFPFAPHLAFWQVVLGGLERRIFILATGGGKAIGTDANLRLIDRMKPTAILGVPGYVYHLFRRAEEEKVRLPNLRRVVLGAERVPAGFADRLAEIARRLGAGGGAGGIEVLGTYGFTEARMAWGECAPGAGYHLYGDLGYFEIVDPTTGEVQPDGRGGEVVFTPIGAHGSVVVRYRTGDLSEGGIVWDECPHCGRVGPRLDGRISRVSNVKDLQLSKVRGTLVNLSAIGEVLFGFPGVDEWQVEIRKRNDDPHDLDELVVYVSVTPEASAAAPASSARTAAAPAAPADDFREKIAAAVRAATEVRPNEVVVLPNEELRRRLGLEESLKEKRFIDRRDELQSR